MFCIGCARPVPNVMCSRCRSNLHSARRRLLPGGVLLIAAFEHTGLAARLVHDLKYRGATGYADLVAGHLASELSSVPIVPIPRSFTRYARYGVDPSMELARRIADLVGAPLIDAFRRTFHSRRRAAHNLMRPAPQLLAREIPAGRVIVVDDVVTTGATLMSAVSALGIDRVDCVVAANDAMTRSTLSPMPPAANPPFSEQN